MKNIRYQFIAILSLVAGSTLFYSCGDDFLDQPPLGALSEETLQNERGINALLIGAYAALDGQQENNGTAQLINGGDPWSASPDNWIYGSVAGGDAHKGSNGADQPGIDAIATFISDPSNGFFNGKWRMMYEGINRANTVLRAVANVEDMPEADRINVMGQARFLRGHFYFELKRMFNNVPWIDEETEDMNQPNDQDIWPLIEEDFLYAYENLPETQGDVGRVNRWAAAAYLGKTYLYQDKFNDAQSTFDEVINQGQTSNGIAYDLMPNFADNFNPAVENNAESVFAIQMVANDGTNTIANANQGSMLNFPYNSPFRCCGFFQPSQELVNSYRTNAQGLPLIDTYNQNEVANDMGITSNEPFTPDAGALDPRLDWTVGRRGVPYLDWGNHPGREWTRDQTYGGPYSPKKNVYWQATQDQYADQSFWAPGTATNVLIIRFADVLLMAAEAEVHTGNLAQAEEYVNLVRARAANPDGFVHQYVDPANPMDGFTAAPAANYTIAPYPAGTFAGGGNEFALDAIYFERKLELAMEGHRFFDLVRWGEAESQLNRYFAYESQITTDIRGGSFTSGVDEYFPIPQRQIDLSANGDGTPTLTQNPGYN